MRLAPVPGATKGEPGRPARSAVAAVEMARGAFALPSAAACRCSDRAGGIAMEARELEERIAAFPRWRYTFEFEDGVSDAGARSRRDQPARAAPPLLLRAAAGAAPAARCADAGSSTSAATPATGRCSPSRRTPTSSSAWTASRPTSTQAELVFEAKGIDAASATASSRANVFEHALRRAFRRGAVPGPDGPRAPGPSSCSS